MSNYVQGKFSLSLVQNTYRDCEEVPQVMLAGKEVFEQLWIRVRPEDRDPRDAPLAQLGWRTIRWDRAEIVEWAGLLPMEIYFVSQRSFRLWIKRGIERQPLPDALCILQTVA
jgi:hypothetical protein